MEFVDNCNVVKKYCPSPSTYNQENEPPTKKCTRVYVQPPRAVPIAPKNAYCPAAPNKPIESTTIYHTSYVDAPCNTADQRQRPFIPTDNMGLVSGKFADDTTTRLSYKPVDGAISKQKPIVPKKSKLQSWAKGPMESVTTIRHSYGKPVLGPKLELIVPCANIRASRAAFSDETTTTMSFVDPGRQRPVVNFKPQSKYRKPEEPLPKETTQRLSYVPCQVPRREELPWARKPRYKPPEVAMPTATTYGKSYHENKGNAREQPIVPKEMGIRPLGAEFDQHTIYRESYVPCRSEPTAQIVHSDNMKLSVKKMEGDTTNKLSYQLVKGEKRKAIVPSIRRNLTGKGPLESRTTTRLSYVQPKILSRVEPVVPCGNIRASDKPLEGRTTTGLSYLKPRAMEKVKSYKPVQSHLKPEAKLEDNTVNSLSYKKWQIGPKQELPWVPNPTYKKPQSKMQTDTVCRMSFALPGHFIEVGDC